jgi:hypothetical protein
MALQQRFSEGVLIMNTRKNDMLTIDSSAPDSWELRGTIVEVGFAELRSVTDGNSPKAA